MEQKNYAIKVKNVLGKDKQIELLDGSKYMLKDKNEKIIGLYNEQIKPIIFKLLKSGFEVSKILEENIKEHMIINNTNSDLKKAPEVINNEVNIDNQKVEEKPKKRRGRPPKNAKK